jgi:hypothetical protein
MSKGITPRKPHALAHAPPSAPGAAPALSTLPLTLHAPGQTFCITRQAPAEG